MLPVAGGIAVALVAHANAPKLYTSETVLVIDVRSQQVLPSESVIAPLSQENPVISSELDIIRSRSLAKSAVERLKKRGIDIPASPVSPGPMDAYVRPALARLVDALSSPATVAKAGAVTLVGATVRDPADPETAELEVRRSEIDSLLAGLAVSNDGRSYTIFITYVSEDALYSAEAANAFAEAYINYQVSLHELAAQRATASLAPRVENLRKQLQNAEQRLQAYRRDAGLMAEKGVTMEVQRLSALNDELVAARAAIAQAQARFESVKAVEVGGEPPRIDSVVMQSLLAERARLDRARASLEDRGALMSLDLGDILASLDAVDGQIREEAERGRELLAREVEVAERKEELLRQDLAQTQVALDDAEKAIVEAAQLERDVESTSDIYTSYLTRYKEAIEQEGAAIPEARIVSAAEAGSANSSSRAAKLLLAGIGVGGMIGLGGAGLRGWREGRLASPETIAGQTQLPILGYLPSLSARALRSAETGPFSARSRWNGAVAELLANTSLVLGRRPAVMAVTSTARRDGKTTVALAFGRAAAASGARTLVIDGNLHAPELASRLDLIPERGLRDVLEGKATLGEAVLRIEERGFDVLTADPTGMPEIVLAGGDVAALLAAARRSYDMIVIDCPAINVFPDAAHLAEHADLTVLVIRSDGSLFTEVVWAMDQLTAVAPRCERRRCSTGRDAARCGWLERALGQPFRERRMTSASALSRPRTLVQERSANFVRAGAATTLLGFTAAHAEPYLPGPGDVDRDHGLWRSRPVRQLPRRGGRRDRAPAARQRCGGGQEPGAASPGTLGRARALPSQSRSGCPHLLLCSSLCPWGGGKAGRLCVPPGDDGAPARRARRRIPAGHRRRTGRFARACDRSRRRLCGARPPALCAASGGRPARGRTRAVGLRVRCGHARRRRAFGRTFRIVEAESRLFELRRDALRSSDAGITAQISGFAHEIASLTESVKLYDEETRLLAEDVEATRTLVERSIATPIRLREVLRAQSATRRDALDTRASLARAKQGMLEAERSREALREDFRTSAATTLREVELELAAARRRLDTMLDTLVAIGDDGDRTFVAGPRAATALVIVRLSEAGAEEILAEERTLLRPGDILRIENGPQQLAKGPAP